MNRLGTVLAGIDFGGAGSDAAMWAAIHLHPQKVVLGHVVAVPRLPSFLGRPPGGDLQLEETLVTGARSRLEALARELGEDVGGRFTSDVRVGGGVAEALEEMAEEVDADLSALGPHDRRKGGWNPLGTIPSRVLHEAKRPTLIARGALGTAPKRVLAAIDESAVSAHVLDWLRWTSEQLGADPIAIHVIDYPVREFARNIEPPGKRGRGELEIEEQASEWLRGRLTEAGLPEGCQVHVALGEPEMEILAAARRLEADLLILGTRGAGALGRFFLGTVAQAVARKAACPVLLLPLED